MRSSFGQGFKSPSLYQLYSNYGTRMLRPEAGESWDAGIEQHMRGGRLDMSATYFQRYSRDLIEFFDCATLDGLPQPLGRLLRQHRARGRPRCGAAGRLEATEN